MQPIVRILIVVSSTSLWVGELYIDVEKEPVISTVKASTDQCRIWLDAECWCLAFTAINFQDWMTDQRI